MENTENTTRAAVFLWLKNQAAINNGIFDRNTLMFGFSYLGQQITLIGQKGIWFPKGFQIPISITTTSAGPYDDGFTEEGFLDYRYRGVDPNHRDNIGLREAFRQRIPLIYFHSIKPGKYQAVWPIYIIEDNPSQLHIRAAIDPAYQQIIDFYPNKKELTIGNDSELSIRRYITALTKQRLHQSAFREFVLEAYSHRCTICMLQHDELLDAAHIIPDSDERGVPVVQNGLSLCKIHHAAYDKNIFSIGPNYVINVRKDILLEQDGPMLKYGLQSINDKEIILPKRKKDYPDRDRLNVRFKEFISSQFSMGQ